MAALGLSSLQRPGPSTGGEGLVTGGLPKGGAGRAVRWEFTVVLKTGPDEELTPERP